MTAKNALMRPDYLVTYDLASRLGGASVLPKHIKSEADAVALMLTGQELGLQPMQALRSLHMIDGRVELSAHLMLTLMTTRLGVKFSWLESTATVAKLKLERPDQAPHVEEMTIADAERAGLASRGTWQKYPKQMLRARAISNAARAYTPEILTGCYVEGEITEARLVDEQPDTEPESVPVEVEVFDVEVEEVEPEVVEEAGPAKLDSATRGKLLAWMGKAKVEPEQVAQWVGIPWAAWTDDTAKILREALKADGVTTLKEIRSMEQKS